MDVDGGEDLLLDPVAVPALLPCSVLVELHEHLLPGIRETLTQRFTSTHDVEYIAPRDRSWRDAQSVSMMGRRQLTAAMREARPDGQGWLWMRPREI